jgi:hypothetical protein
LDYSLLPVLTPAGNPLLLLLSFVLAAVASFFACTEATEVRPSPFEAHRCAAACTKWLPKRYEKCFKTSEIKKTSVQDQAGHNTSTGRRLKRQQLNQK